MVGIFICHWFLGEEDEGLLESSVFPGEVCVLKS
jgi:hypothetical protein